MNNTTKAEIQRKINRVVDRAQQLGLVVKDRFTISMDLDSAGQEFDMDWDRLLEADNPDFIHDVLGIQYNIVRSGYPATDFQYFVPRFAGKSKAS